jgi:PAS domain S-box-containing protein
MNLKDLRIGTQLQLGFAVMLLFVIALGLVAYWQTDKIQQQTEDMYNHPLPVIAAISKLQSDVLNMRLNTRDLMLATSDQEKQITIQSVELASADALQQLNVLKDKYLGPRSDIDEAHKAFIRWNTARVENNKLILSGEIEQVRKNISSTGFVGIYREQMMDKINIIDEFATKKADTLYASSNDLNDSLNNQLIVLLIVIILLSILINYLISTNIRKPLVKLTDVANRFYKGNMDARSGYTSKNEFGKLSESFNLLASNIQTNTELDHNSADILRVTLSKTDANEFFQVSLSTLAAYTNSQIAAVYLLSNDKKTFDLFESLGADHNAKQSFDAGNFEGEFGVVLSSHKVSHLKNLPADSSFVFHTVSGKYIPHEMITIPILADSDIIAIISLATVNNYKDSSLKLIENILDTLSVRIEGVLAYRKIKEFSGKIEKQKEEIEKAGKYNRGLIEASIDPLVTIGQDGRITDVNNATEAVTGLAREKLIGTDFAKYFTDPELAMAGYQLVFKDGIVRDYELAIRHISGRITPVLYNATVYRDETGEVVGVFAAARDITEQKFIEKELNRLNEDLTLRSENLTFANRELEAQKTELTSQSAELAEQNAELEMQKKLLQEASQLKTSFLSNMSHELRTPLNSVIALSGVLNRRLDKKIPEEEYSYLEVIERNGKHLLSLINDILDISRIESGREEIEITKFNANNLIADVVSMVYPQAKQKKIKLLHKTDGSELIISNDANKCRHILQNLIGNAVKFTDKGKVEISAQQIGEKVLITVADTGIGMAENQLPHIFDEFRQADGSTSRRFGGTGLGLAIAKKYANMLGGTITVKSVPESGSEFILELPLQIKVGNRMIESESTGSFNHKTKQTNYIHVGNSAAITILLVEDSEPAIIQMKDILEERGYHLLVAHHGSDALEIIAKTIPDAMILDLMMPGIDGFEVLKTLREAEPTAHIPVLILTAKHITKEELKFLKRNNVHELIQKGDINRNDLQNAVASMVFPEPVETKKIVPILPIITGKPVILVVEDNPDNMLTVKAVLADDYIIIEATDGASGIEMARIHQPDLILMDIGLPGMDGIEAFKAIRKDLKLENIPVIALTASAMTFDREAILASGVDAYIPKPIDEKVLFKTINEVLYGK